MLKVFGSPHCPDCVACKAILEKNHVPFEYIDITGSIRALKQFLALRDHSEAYDEAKEEGYIGIPTLVLEDGTIRFDYEEWLKEEKISKIGIVKSGQSCNIDGTGC